MHPSDKAFAVANAMGNIIFACVQRQKENELPCALARGALRVMDAAAWREGGDSPTLTPAALRCRPCRCRSYAFSMILIELADTIKTDAKGCVTVAGAAACCIYRVCRRRRVPRRRADLLARGVPSSRTPTPPRRPVWHMRRAVSVSLAVTSTFYLLVSVMGYATFGNATCEDIVTCFGTAPDGSPSSVPSGVIQAINIMVRCAAPAARACVQALCEIRRQQCVHVQLPHARCSPENRWHSAPRGRPSLACTMRPSQPHSARPPHPSAGGGAPGAGLCRVHAAPVCLCGGRRGAQPPPAGLAPARAQPGT